ncbi:MAG: bifunctional 3'-5' exonuclease/DNA polymerase, partial [Planctomycetota bacterium]
MTDAPPDRPADGGMADAAAGPPSAGTEAPAPVPPAVAEALRRVVAFERQNRRLASERDVDAIAEEAGAPAEAVRAGLA